MRKTLVTVALVMTVTRLYASGEKTEAPPSFTNLQQAVQFISSSLTTTNFVAIRNACVSPKGKPKDHILLSLKQKHKETPLPELYAKISFPTNSPRFKLGGHMKELGSIHIDFQKEKDVWSLTSIWMCR